MRKRSASHVMCIRWSRDVLQVEVFSVLHTAARQHKELVHTLLPHLSANMSPVEAASVLLKGDDEVWLNVGAASECVDELQ